MAKRLPHDQLFGTPYVCRSWLSATLDTLFHNSELDLRRIDSLEGKIQRSRFTHLLRIAINRCDRNWVSIHLQANTVLVTLPQFT
ncbi:hypothetical protein Ddye_026689 [Dipteronia dyeriana]|uniref:Uncharacterized protein n=1 Tax=Dipteronia dyeriana TaxID=168575 RepID=A0AAD9WPG0_9ROSI|nr:hypothetical protein Ddye_026689 [Dipteronia dyeriana]